MIACGVQYCCVGKVQDLLLKFKISLAIILLHVFLATSDTSNIVTSRSTVEKSSGTISEESPIFTLITYPINASATTSDTSSAERTLSALTKPNHTETTNNPEFNFSTTVAESSIVTFITYPINASDTTSLERTSPEDRTLSIWPEANQTVCYTGSVKFNYSEKSNNASGNVVRIDDVTTSDKFTKFIPFTTPTLQESKISEFNKTLQEESKSSVMECAAENQSISICKFILANTANISNIIAYLKDRAEIVQIEQCFCSALQSSSTTAKELQKLQCDGKDTVIYTTPSKLGPPPFPGASSTKISNDFSGHAFHPPKHTPIFPPHFPDEPSIIPTVPPAIPFTSIITQAASPPLTTTIPPATSSPAHTTRISPAMPFTKSTTISLPTSPPKLAVPSTVSSTETSSMAPVSSTEPTITTPPGIHSTSASQATGANSTTGNILDNLSNITHATSNSSEVESIISKLESALLDRSIEPKVAREMVDIISNLLNVPYSVLSPMSKRIIKIVDAIGLKLNFSTESINFTSPALALAVTKVNSSSFSKMSFTVQDSSDLQISLGAQAPINSVGAIALPSSLLTNLPSEHKPLASRITFNFFEKTTPFQDPSLKNISLISNVISSSVANLTLSDLKANVTVTLQNTRPNLDNLTVRCAFWDLNENGGKGGWSYEGCMVKERRANETVCTCNHLTSFGVLLDLSRNTTLPPIQALILTFITYIGCGLSAIFLSITLVTYIAFEKIRRDYPSKILIQLCAALLLLNIVFLLDSWIALYNIQGLCITVAVFLHYFLLVSFTWMGLEAFHMYLALVKVFNTYVRKYILKFCIVGWGVPLIVVVIVLAITPNNYGLGSYGKFPNGSPDEFCWINNNIVFYITVVGYFCMIFLLNISMFIVVLIQLCRIKKKKQLGTQRKTSIHDLRSVAGLTFLLGITWGFAFFAWGPVNLVFMYLFAIFNTLQGFFIFIFYCVAKENVRKQWRRYLCCGKFRLAENSDWSRTATNGLKKQTVNQGVSSSSNSLQSNCNSTNSTTLLVNNDYSVLTNGNGNVSSEKNGVSFSVQNGDVCLHDFSGKQLIFHEKDDADHKKTRVSLRRTSKRGSLHFIKQM